MPIDTDKLQAVLDEPRNGINSASPHSVLFPAFYSSDGAQELATAAGCYWLLDILATELGPKLLHAISECELETVTVQVQVGSDRAAVLRAVCGDPERPIFWQKAISHADLPAGDWTLFEVGAGDWDLEAEIAVSLIAILPSEH